jgi:hypothetical protein
MMWCARGEALKDVSSKAKQVYERLHLATRIEV